MKLDLDTDWKILAAKFKLGYYTSKLYERIILTVDQSARKGQKAGGILLFL